MAASPDATTPAPDAIHPALQLYLVRHAQTAWSLTGQHTGVTDLPLTAHGLASAMGLLQALKDVHFLRVLTSPRLRARTTCEQAGLGAAARIDADLAEWDYGSHEGLRTAQIRQHWPQWDLWRDGCPGGESPAQVGARADRLIQRLGPLAGNVILFTHGQFGRALAARWIGLPVAQGRHLDFDPLRIGILGQAVDHPGRRVISLWNASAPGGHQVPGAALAGNLHANPPNLPAPAA